MAGAVALAWSSAPAASFAQDAVPPPPSAAEAAHARRWVVPPPEEPEPDEHPPIVDRGSQVDPAGDVWLEIAGGTIGMLVGGAMLAGGIFLTTTGDTDRECSGACGPLLVGGLIGIFVLPALGVTIAGDSSGGEGNFAAALLGTLPGALLFLPGMIVGAVAGYRISAPDKPTARSPQAQSGVLLVDLRF